MIRNAACNGEIFMAPKSENPLLKVGSATIVTTATAPVSDYVDLLQVGCDPNTKIYLRDIILEVDSTTTNIWVNLYLDGTRYIKDTPFLSSAGAFGFGGDLVLTETKKAVWIQVKSTAAGTVRVNAYVTGIMVPNNSASF
jgi:hypothetical protein